MKQKVLFVAHMLRGHVLVFHLPYMKWFQEQGYEVHLCSCNDTEKPVTQVPYCDRFLTCPFSARPSDGRIFKCIGKSKSWWIGRITP